MIKSAVAAPMLSTRRQDTVSDADRFRYDGKSVADPQVQGHWEVIHAANKVEDFRGI